MILPGMSGTQLAAALLALRSGMMVQGMAEKDIHFIQKPFTAENLLRQVQEVMDDTDRKRARRHPGA